MGLLSWMFDRRAAAWQSGLIEGHCAEVENIYRQMRGWRHDYHNHIQAMKGLALGVSTELDSYLNRLDTDLVRIDTLIKTGNVMIDAILNSKISLARAKNIAVNAKAIVPKTLSVLEIDLCVIIGNLLDNAMEACEKLVDSNERFIRIYVGTHKELLYISITNSVGGEIRKSSAGYLSTKLMPTHGFGLIRIDKLAEKYNGFVDRQNEEGVFATEIMLPL